MQHTHCWLWAKQPVARDQGGPEVVTAPAWDVPTGGSRAVAAGRGSGVSYLCGVGIPLSLAGEWR